MKRDVVLLNFTAQLEKARNILKFSGFYNI